MTNTNWRTQAACRDSDPELFYPIAPDGHGKAAAAAPAVRWCPPVSRRRCEWEMSTATGVAGPVRSGPTWCGLGTLGGSVRLRQWRR